MIAPIGMPPSTDLGIDYNALWNSVKQAGAELVTKDLPAAVQRTVEQKVVGVATPVVQQAATAKAQAAYSKGNVIGFAVGGVGLGAILAGGGWQRRTIGAVVLGGLGAFLGFKIGFLKDSL